MSISSNVSRAILVAVAGVAAAVAVPSDADAQIQMGRNLARPELRVGCPIPTLAQCQDPNYLENDRCGILERTNQWTCSELLEQEMMARQGQKVLSTVPRSFDEGGVAHVIPTPPEPNAADAQYKADTFSYSSQVAASSYAGAANIAINEYAAWAASGTKVDSCREYVHERFYDVTEFTRVIAPKRNDHEAVYGIAFGPVSSSSSIGTRHIGDPRLRGKDGRVFGTMLAPQQRVKNGFVAIAPTPSFSLAAPPSNAPNLLAALQISSRGQALIAKAALGRELVTQSWLWHKTTHDKLVYVPGASPGTILVGFAPASPQQQIAATFGTTGGTNPIRKRLPAELDELYALQQRFRQLQMDWARLNERFAGSAWKVSELGTLSGASSFVAPAATGTAPLVLGFATTSGVQKPPTPTTDAPESETVLRRRLVTEMLELLDRADDEGCLDKGLTACDWSPKYFATTVANDFSDEQDRAFSDCNAFTGGNFQKLKNLNLPFVDDPAYPQFRCVVKTGATLTAQQYDALRPQVDECRQKEILYKEAKALAAAKERVAKIPELVDPDTGNFKKPGISKSRDELMGNKYFGLGYNYDLGWLVDAQPEICKLQIDAHGSFLAYANVFGSQRNLLDAQALFDTEKKNLHLHLKVAGKDVFTPVDKTWSAPAPLSYQITKDFGTGKKGVTLVKTYIVVVVIPIKIEAGISGEVGLTLGMRADASGFDNQQCPKAKVSGLVEPYVAVNGYLEAGIDVLIASAGIRGELTIIRASTPFTTGVELALLSGTLAPENLELRIDTRLGVKLQTLNGSIRAYAQAGFCPLCVRGEKEIVGWEGPSLDMTLFNQIYKVNLKDLGIAFGGQ
jgi:hypothetical protein